MRDLLVTSLPVHEWTTDLFRPCLVAAALCSGIGWQQACHAQGHNQPAGQPTGQPAGNMGAFRPGASGGAHGGGAMQSRPPGMPMAPGMGGPGGQPGTRIPGSAVDSPKGPVPEFKIDSEALPENYAPPAAKDKMMTDEVRLAEQDEIDKLKKDFSKYQNALRKSEATEAERALIRNGIRYRLALMCLKENRTKLTELHEALLRDMNNTLASVPTVTNPAVIKEFRRSVLQELVNQIDAMVGNQNFYVRLHLVMLLGEIDLTPENPKLGFKLEAFAPSSNTLVKVLLDPQQPEAVKILAVNELVRILRVVGGQGGPNVTMRTNIANAIVSELKANKSHLREEKPNSWYQMRLIGALSVVDIDLDQAKQPFVVNVLKMILTDPDPKRTMAVRAEAAKSLGRVPLPPAANPQSVTREVAGFALKLAKEAQQSPPTKADDPKWKSEFFKVYLAFQPLDANDQTADKKKAGLLNNPAAAAKSAYDLIVPLVAAILHGQRLTVQQIQNLEAYVQPAGSTQTSQSVPAKKGNATEANGNSTETKSNGANSSPVSLDARGPKQ